MTATSRLARGAVALTALALLVVGVPVFLALVVGWPLPHGNLSVSGISDALDGTTPIPDAFWFGALACLGWVMWLRVTIAVVAETRAAIAGRPASDHGVRRLMGSLVAAALLIVASTRSARPAAAEPVRPLPAAAAPHATAAPTLQAAPAAAAAPTWTVARNDTLWEIAERTLGDPLRWHDIYDLNEGRPQPDGGALADPSLLRPGWTLQLPTDAATAPAHADAVTVEAGDTLSGIAQRRLGDPDRFPDLFAANAGITQPDGDSLEDPNLIRPGWHIDIPDTTSTPDPIAPPPPPPPKLPTETPSTAPPPTTPPVTAPITTPLTSPAPTVNGSINGTPATAPAEGDTAPALALLATAGSAITSAAVLTMLRRRRRRQRAARPPHAAPVPSPVDTVEGEQHLRITSDDEALAWVEVTGRLLGPALAEFADPPSVVLVRAGLLGVEVVLDRPCDPSAPFLPGDSPNTWQLNPALRLDGAIARGAVQVAAAPTLVSIGATLEGTVLFNLEHAGTLAVTGDPDRVAAWFRGAAAELTTAPWATDLPVITAGLTLTGPDSADLRLVDNAAQAIAIGAEHGHRLRRALGATAPRTARLRDHPDEAWLPAVALIATSNGEANAEPPDTGNIVVTAQSTATPWRLDLDADGNATLAPLGLQLHAVGLAAATADACGRLLQAAEADPPAAMPGAERRQPAVAALAPEVTAQIDEVLALQPVEVCILRPEPTVEGWADPTRLRGKATELVVYLAMAGRSVGAQRIRNDLWGGELVTNDTWKSTNSRARAALGTDATGEFRLPHADTSRFQLGGEVGCDWQRFRRLVELARDADATAATAYLTAALDLVNGAPFSDCGYRYRWAEDHLPEFDAIITDAAHDLAKLALAEFNHELATWATERGHLANPDQQALFDARMVARAMAGDTRGVHDTYEGMRSSLRRLDPLAEIPEEVEGAYAEALRLASSATRATG